MQIDRQELLYLSDSDLGTSQFVELLTILLIFVALLLPMKGELCCKDGLAIFE